MNAEEKKMTFQDEVSSVTGHSSWPPHVQIMCFFLRMLMFLHGFGPFVHLGNIHRKSLKLQQSERNSRLSAVTACTGNRKRLFVCHDPFDCHHIGFVRLCILNYGG